MSTRDELQPWIVDALQNHGGQAPITDVARFIWLHHEPELRSSDDLFYKWQYESSVGPPGNYAGLDG